MTEIDYTDEKLLALSIINSMSFSSYEPDGDKSSVIKTENLHFLYEESSYLELRFGFLELGKQIIENISKATGMTHQAIIDELRVTFYNVPLKDDMEQENMAATLMTITLLERHLNNDITQVRFILQDMQDNKQYMEFGLQRIVALLVEFMNYYLGQTKTETLNQLRSEILN